MLNQQLEDNMEKTEKEKLIYIKGYYKGFMAAQMLMWHLAEQLLIEVDNNSKDAVRKLIEKVRQ
jgi:hypothetical protein